MHILGLKNGSHISSLIWLLRLSQYCSKYSSFVADHKMNISCWLVLEENFVSKDYTKKEYVQ